MADLREFRREVEFEYAVNATQSSPASVVKGFRSEGHSGVERIPGCVQFSSVSVSEN